MSLTKPSTIGSGRPRKEVSVVIERAFVQLTSDELVNTRSVTPCKGTIMVTHKDARKTLQQKKGRLSGAKDTGREIRGLMLKHQ